MTKEDHIETHKHLHRKLDELLADFFTITGKLPSKATCKELMSWSHDQTFNPTNKEEEGNKMEKEIFVTVAYPVSFTITINSEDDEWAVKEQIFAEAGRMFECSSIKPIIIACSEPTLID